MAVSRTRPRMVSMENLFGKTLGVILLSGTLLTGNAMYSQASAKPAKIKAKTDARSFDVSVRPPASPRAKDIAKNKRLSAGSRVTPHGE